MISVIDKHSALTKAINTLKKMSLAYILKCADRFILGDEDKIIILETTKFSRKDLQTFFESIEINKVTLSSYDAKEMGKIIHAISDVILTKWHCAKINSLICRCGLGLDMQIGAGAEGGPLTEYDQSRTLIDYMIGIFVDQDKLFLGL